MLVFPCVASAPMALPGFTRPYQGVLRLVQCRVLHQLLHCVLRLAADPNSKVWSDKLLHETLYLCAVMLAEEDSKHPSSLANAAIGDSQSKCLTMTVILRQHISLTPLT